MVAEDNRWKERDSSRSESTSESPSWPDGPKNVLLLIADDLNSWMFGDAHRYAGEVVAPNLRKLAASGVNFTRAYTASPVCSPSRTAFFSGVAPWRSGHYHNTLQVNCSLVPLLKNPQAEWKSTAITGLSNKKEGEDAYLTICNESGRYTRYQDGQEEFYNTGEDPHEWKNQISNPEFHQTIAVLRNFITDLPEISTPLKSVRRKQK